MKLFAGLEGGASCSKLVIISQSGQIVVSDQSGPPTNHWLIGLEECLSRIAQMLTTCLSRIKHMEPVESLCLCLSGCEDKKENREMAREFLRVYPHLTKSCFVESDTLAPLFSCQASSGVVLIAGTGSNCLLFDSDQTVGCGGWGHILGDYGSAFWISLEAVKAVMENEDQYWDQNKDLDRLKQSVFQFFQIKTFPEILDQIYRNFSKPKFAAFCLQLSKMAATDPVVKDIFFRAGTHLGRHVKAVLKRANPRLAQQEGGVPIVCMGGVFESWHLLSEGFFSVFDSNDWEMSLKRTNSIVGSALIGAKRIGQNIEIKDISVKVLSHFKDGKCNDFY